MRKYLFPANYQDVFKNRMVIITGVGRSGTTILGKVLGSMAPVYYLFEPAIMKLFLPRSKALPMTLFEDYFLPLIQGRNVNYRKNDWDYIHNYMSPKDLRLRQKIERRKDAMEFFEQENPVFIIKTTEAQPLKKAMKEIFKGVCFIHIARNGNDVISSALMRGWFTDEYINSGMVERVEKRKGNNVPWYLDEESKDYFPTWQPVTRAACVWRHFAGKGACELQDFAGMRRDWQIRYENFILQPEIYLQKFQELLYPQFSLKTTKITRRHLKAIKKFSPRQYPSLASKIEYPEKDKFVELMEKLRYRV